MKKPLQLGGFYRFTSNTPLVTPSYTYAQGPGISELLAIYGDSVLMQGNVEIGMQNFLNSFELIEDPLQAFRVKPYSIQELQNKTRKLEAEILELLRSFESETGLSIRRISLVKIGVELEPTYFIQKVTCKLDI